MQKITKVLFGFDDKPYMRVQQSSISFMSQHRLTRTVERTESLEVWDNRRSLQMDRDVATISEKGRALSGSSSGEDKDSLQVDIDKKYYILARLIAHLTGKDVKIYVPGKTKGVHGGSGREESSGQSGGNEGWGVRYSSMETYTEAEQSVFSAKGVITADGKEYAFSASLFMERTFTVSESVDIRAGDALKDPLVVNLGQNPVDLSGERIRFDIDMDGEDENMPALGDSSGFLVLDRNGNGMVDDGSELFGPATGNGFGELRAFDTDGSGWIDEADPVYSELRVWRQNGDTGVLNTLQELGIGAFYTGSASTPFEIKNGENVTEAMVQETGIYLREDGTVGTVQKIDMAV